MDATDIDNPAQQEPSIDENSASTNALEANIGTKGKNAYYYAHSHKASGPKWDGK